MSLHGDVIIQRHLKEIEKAFKDGWECGYADGGEHDCRMFAPTAKRAWEEYKKSKGIQ